LSEWGFEKLLLEAVDEALSSLGDSAKYTIYCRLERVFKIRRRDIPHKIEEFSDAIEKIFGSGAKVLEVLIMKRLYEKVGGVIEYPERDNLTFTEYVAAARQSFLKRERARVPAIPTVPTQLWSQRPRRGG